MRPEETYNDQIVRLFLLAAAIWGIVGMAIGVYIAAEMAWFWERELRSACWRN